VAVLAGCAIVALAILLAVAAGGFFAYRSFQIATEQEAAALQAERAARDRAAAEMAGAKAESSTKDGVTQPEPDR